MFANFTRMETKDDVFPWNACCVKFFSYGFRCAIVLNPNFAVLDVNMYDTTMNPSLPIPTDVHDFKVILLVINHHFGLDVPI